MRSYYETYAEQSMVYDSGNYGPYEESYYQDPSRMRRRRDVSFGRAGMCPEGYELAMPKSELEAQAVWKAAAGMAPSNSHLSL
jgi:hypothetical protein